MKRHIPNLITCMNVTSGSLAVFMAFYGRIETAAWLILLAMVFDFFDGFSARLLHVKSELGKELDSLSDVVSFGFAPAVLAHLLMRDLLPAGMGMEDFCSWNLGMKCCFLAPLLMPAFSAYRLAKFNLDTRQTTSFIGMPTPANALFWVALVLGSVYAPETYRTFFGSCHVLGAASLILSVLLVSELPMFSLKLSGFGWKENRFRYTYLACMLILLAVLGRRTMLLVIPMYLLFAVVEALLKVFTSGSQDH